MSIVTYKDGIIAADSNTIFDGNSVCYTQGKIIKYMDYLLGGVGNKGLINLFINNFIKFTYDYLDEPQEAILKFSYQKELKELNLKHEDHFQIMLIHKNYQNSIYDFNSADPAGTFVNTNLELNPTKPAYHAIGSGTKYAHAILFMNKSAKEAAKVARDLDIYCGGSIQSLSF